MKRKILLGFGLVTLIAVGCSSNKELLASSIDQAEGMRNAAQAENIQSESSVAAEKDLTQAKNWNENGEETAAMEAALSSILEYRLAFAEHERDSLARADSASVKALRGDEETQKLYRTILENETQGKDGAK